ncbi:MAG: hypothetical protein ACRD13_05180, partial [Terriglobales bacterium]
WPWRSPYLCWRLETYTGKPAEEVRLRDFVSFAWAEPERLWRFVRWCGEMRRWRKLSRQPMLSAFAGPEEREAGARR